jgi:hypothetical protein
MKFPKSRWIKPKMQNKPKNLSSIMRYMGSQRVYSVASKGTVFLYRRGTKSQDVEPGRTWWYHRWGRKSTGFWCCCRENSANTWHASSIRYIYLTMLYNSQRQVSISSRIQRWLIGSWRHKVRSESAFVREYSMERTLRRQDPIHTDRAAGDSCIWAHTRGAVDPYIQQIRLPILAIRSGREDGESADTWRTRRPWWLRRKYGEAMALPRPPIHCPRTPGSNLNLQRYLSPSSFLQPPNEGVSEAPSPCPSPWVWIRLLQLAGDTVDF